MVTTTLKITPEERESALEWARKWHSTPLARALLAAVAREEELENAIRENAGCVECADEGFASPECEECEGTGLPDWALAASPKETTVEPSCEHGASADDFCMQCCREGEGKSREASRPPPAQVVPAATAAHYRPPVGTRARLVASPDPDDDPRMGEVFTVLGLGKSAASDPANYWRCLDDVEVERYIHRDATWEPVEAKAEPVLSAYEQSEGKVEYK